MTIYNGSQGTICLYFKGKLISSFPLTKKKTVDKYFNQGEEIIYQSKGIPIKTQIKTYLHFCNLVYLRKINNQPIRRTDHIYFLNSLMALLRLKIIDNDIEDGELNGFMVFPKKKKKKLSVV